MAGLARAALEFGQNLAERDAARMQHHQEMIEKIGAFVDERLASPSMAAITASTASSPIFLAARAGPPSSSDFV